MILFAVVVVAVSACARRPWFVRASGSAPALELSLTLGQDKYQPGEAVVCAAVLTNTTKKPLDVPSLDHASVAFSIAPLKEGGQGQLRFIDPVYSEKEQTGQTVTIAPGDSLQYRFLFTRLTFERGRFVLQAIYTGGAGIKGTVTKVYAKPVTFGVEGEKVLAHRYLDGILTKDDAIKLAAAQAGGKLRRADAVMVHDEMGFPVWWVNLWLEGKDASKPAKSYYIDPLLVSVLGEAEPFTRPKTPEGPPNLKDSKMVDRLRQKRDARMKR